MRSYREMYDVVVLPGYSKRVERSMMMNPDKALCDAVVEDDREKFHTALSMASVTAEGLNRAFFLATGYERQTYRAIFLRRAAKLSIDGDMIEMQASANGLLLRSVLRGDEAGIRVGLRNSGVNVNAFDGECFKQAILNDHLRIAGTLYYAGTNIGKIASDDGFMHKVNTTSHGVTDTGRKLVHHMIKEFVSGPTLSAVA